MATHKDLITKYVKQLSDSQQRIFELELALANCEADVEKAKANGSNQQKTDTTEVDRLRTELAGKEKRIVELANELQSQAAKDKSSPAIVLSRQLREAKEHVKRLDQALESRNSSLGHWKEQAHSAETAKKELIKRLREESDRVKGLQNGLEMCTKQLNVWEQQATSAETAKTEAVKQLAAERDRVRSTQKSLEARNSAVKFWQQQATAAGTRIKEAVEQLAEARAGLQEKQEAFDELQATNSLVTEELNIAQSRLFFLREAAPFEHDKTVRALRNEVDTLNSENERLTKDKEDLVLEKRSLQKIISYTKTTQPRTKADAEILDLAEEVEWQKKRRREAEDAMLGPSKRCKKCNPFVITLDEDSDGFADVKKHETDGVYDNISEHKTMVETFRLVTGAAVVDESNESKILADGY